MSCLCPNLFTIHASMSFIFTEADISKVPRRPTSSNDCVLIQRNPTSQTKSNSLSNIWDSGSGQNSQLLLCILSYIGGSIIQQCRRKLRCDNCVAALAEKRLNNIFLKYKKYTHCKENGGLLQPIPVILTALVRLENIFISNYSTFFREKCVLSQFMNVAASVSFLSTPCHPNLKNFVFKRFFIIRIHHQCKLLTRAIRDNKMKSTKKAKQLGFLIQNLKRH
jgi:hypothetical protein